MTKSTTSTPGRAAKHIPLRKCIVCGGMMPKESLIRFTCFSRDMALTAAGESSGKGAYICRQGACIGLLLEDRRFKKRYHSRISEADRLFLAHLSENDFVGEKI